MSSDYSRCVQAYFCVQLNVQMGTWSHMETSDPQRAPVNTPAESNKGPGCLSRTRAPHAGTRPPAVAGEGQRRRAGT